MAGRSALPIPMVWPRAEVGIRPVAADQERQDYEQANRSLRTQLEEGEVGKLVLTQSNRVRAVVVSVERRSQLEQAVDGDGTSGRGKR